MNIVKDRTIEQPLPWLLDETFALVGTLIRDFSHLGPGGKFVVTPEYPEFVWQEGITNAVTHRAYNITGRPVEVLMFDDRLEIISPGPFPGTVTAETIRHDHFSRNPRIARVLAEMRYIPALSVAEVKDIGEGVNRMYHEMAAAGLPPPEWIEEPAAVRLILRNGIEQRRLATPEEVRARMIVELNDRQRRTIEYLQERGRITNREYRELCSVSDFTARADLNDLLKRGLVISEGRGRSRRYRLAGD
ncbi:MAG: ATP-binding protein [Anaerolineae bacterium]